MVPKQPVYLHVCTYEGECIRAASLTIQGSVIEINTHDVSEVVESLLAAADELSDEDPGVYHRPSTEPV